jgi:hypothetical protein
LLHSSNSVNLYKCYITKSMLFTCYL